MLCQSVCGGGCRVWFLSSCKFVKGKSGYDSSLLMMNCLEGEIGGTSRMRKSWRFILDFSVSEIVIFFWQNEVFQGFVLSFINFLRSLV